MENQGTPVKRWQKPFTDLPAISSPSPLQETKTFSPTTQNSTLLRVNSQLDEEWLDAVEQHWVDAGNTLVILGIREPVTEADFSTIQDSAVGGVKIDTRMRSNQVYHKLLADRFGAVVWQKQLGKGQVIFSTTPHLAANAYQDEPGNYNFLAKLVSTNGKSIWVDEYIHGYKNKDVRVKEKVENWIGYLAKTPVFPAVVQVGVILVILVLAQNRRFGLPITLASPVVDNSEAYMQALASVLQKAQSSELVLEVVGKSEQLQLQKSLGLGTILLDNHALVAAWVQQTGHSPKELEEVLQLQSKKCRINEKDLLAWLAKWQKIRQSV